MRGLFSRADSGRVFRWLPFLPRSLKTPGLPGVFLCLLYTRAQQTYFYPPTIPLHQLTNARTRSTPLSLALRYATHSLHTILGSLELSCLSLWDDPSNYHTLKIASINQTSSTHLFRNRSSPTCSQLSTYFLTGCHSSRSLPGGRKRGHL